MNEVQEIENEERLVDVRIFRVPYQDFEWWMQIVRYYGGNRQTAFRALLEAHNTMLIVGQLHIKLDILGERIKPLEDKWRREGGNLGIKTFGGGQI